jgi:hypothetical protein
MIKLFALVFPFGEIDGEKTMSGRGLEFGDSPSCGFFVIRFVD